MMAHAGHMGHEPEPEPEHGHHSKRVDHQQIKTRSYVEHQSKHHSKHDHQSKRVAIEEVAEEITTIAAEVGLLSPVAP
jgi:hypothetical protein